MRSRDFLRLAQARAGKSPALGFQVEVKPAPIPVELAKPVQAEAPKKTAVDAETFLSVFMEFLIEAKNKYPDQYVWPETDVLEVFRRFANAFRTGTYTRHCHAVNWTCKKLGLKNDRKTIDQIFEENQNETPTF